MDVKTDGFGPCEIDGPWNAKERENGSATGGEMESILSCTHTIPRGNAACYSCMDIENRIATLEQELQERQHRGECCPCCKDRDRLEVPLKEVQGQLKTVNDSELRLIREVRRLEQERELAHSACLLAKERAASLKRDLSDIRRLLGEGDDTRREQMERINKLEGVIGADRIAWKQDRDRLEQELKEWKGIAKDNLDSGDRVQQKNERLREAIRSAANELGVPQPGYPQPVANAADILLAALAAEREEE